MKYYNFKIYKFSTILKKIYSLKYDIKRVYRSIDMRWYNISKRFKPINFKQYDIIKVFKSIKLKNFNTLGINKYITYKKYNFFKIFKIIKNKKILFYTVLLLFFSTFIYVSIPIFFKYEKEKIINNVCKNFSSECFIKGKVKYSIIPSPRLKIDKFIVNNFGNGKKVLLSVENVELKIPLKSILKIKKLSFNKIILRDPKFNISLENFYKYKKQFKNLKKFPIVKTTNAEINFLEKNEHIFDISKANLTYKPGKKSEEVILKGKMLNDEVYINFKNYSDDDKLKKTFVFKLKNSNFVTKINFSNKNVGTKNINGEALIKKAKNRVTANFDYDTKKNKIVFKESNIKNFFLDGKFSGEVEFLPFFNFNLNLDLNGLNFNSIRSYLSNLEGKNKKTLFKLNKKINGKLSISSNKIYSRNGLVNSFESRLHFINGDIAVDQLLLNLGKLGAADISGIIKNTDKYSNFKFENNIFIDNKKRFYSKFGIFNKEKKSTNLFISGNFDFNKFNMHFNEISSYEKVIENDLNFIQSEFNDNLLFDDYVTLFDFDKFKKFLKIVLSEVN